jgi:predicted ATPase
LALALASSLIPSFPDGICFVPLAPLRDGGLLAHTVAHALGLADNSGGGGPQAARLLDFVRHKRLLLVLDNFEHILGATPSVAEWLSGSAYLQIVVTSRSALHLRGERLYPVSTLPVPPRRTKDTRRPATVRHSDHSPAEATVEYPSEATVEYPSVALFVERAQAVDPHFRLSETNRVVVAELCRRMEGLPLAIELTAARSARLTPEIVLARLERRLDIVTHGPRDLPHHQRTLRAAIEWSYELLGEAERLLFDRMSVFAGGATLDALEAVCNAQEDIEGGLDDALDGLLLQSLAYKVVVDGEDDIQASRRFNMLEMLREYAAERLVERENEWAVDGLDERRKTKEEGQPSRTTHYALGTTSVRRYHAEYFLAMAEAAELQKHSGEQEKWLERLDRDHDNLRAAIQWALDTGDVNMAAAVCGGLWNFWKVRGYLSEGRSWFDKVLPYEADISPLTFAKAMNGAGVLVRGQADYAMAASMHERSLAIFRELDDKPGIATGLNNLGVDYHYMDQVDRAEALYQESMESWRALGDLDAMATPLHNLGLIAQSRDDDRRAISLFRESLKIDRARGNKDGIASSLYNLGAELLYASSTGAGDPEDRDENWAEAERSFTESLALGRELGDKLQVALCLTKLGELALERGVGSNLIEATALFEDGLALLRELGDREAIAYALNDLGHATLYRGDRTSARSHFEESLELSQTLETPGKVILSLGSLAVTIGADALAANSKEVALCCARQATQLYAAFAELHGPNLVPSKHHYYQATMDAVHALLPPDDLEALQALGQKMSVDEAIALAVVRSV